jgi:hypothetical protein
VFTIKKRTYQICLECGQEFPYSWELMRTVRSGADGCPCAAEPYRTPRGFCSLIWSTARAALLNFVPYPLMLSMVNGGVPGFEMVTVLAGRTHDVPPRLSVSGNAMLVRHEYGWRLRTMLGGVP